MSHTHLYKWQKHIFYYFQFEFDSQLMDYSLNEEQKSMMQSVSKNITGNFDLHPHPLYSSNKGQVFHITNKLHKQSFALKAIWNLNCQSAYKHQKNIHSSLKNRYIVKLQNAFSDKINFYLVLQYCKNGNLRSLINKKMSIQEVKQYGLQIAKGLDYLHKKKNIIHHNIRPQNILLTENNQIKICDFGAAVVFEEGKNVKGCEVSLNYSPPQAIQMHNQKYDIWSYGCVLYEMAVGKVPFAFKNWKEMVLTMNEAHISNYKYESFLSPSLVHLFKKIFVFDYDQRPSIDQVMKHPFFTGDPLQLSEKRQKSEQRQLFNSKKISSKSSFKSVQLKQSKKSNNKQNKQYVNRVNAVKKANPPNYKEIIEKKFKTSNQVQLSRHNSGQKILNKTSKQLKTEQLKINTQTLVLYDVKTNNYKGNQKSFSPLNTRNMAINPLKLKSYQIRIDKQGFTRESTETNIPQHIKISADGHIIKMRKGKREKVFSYDALPSEYYKEYEQCKRLLLEIQNETSCVQYINKNYQGKTLALKVMYDNTVSVTLQSEFQLKNLKPEEFLSNVKNLPERHFKKLRNIYVHLSETK